MSQEGWDNDQRYFIILYNIRLLDKHINMSNDSYAKCNKYRSDRSDQQINKSSTTNVT